MARVFISYRRSESRWAAGRLYDRLSEVIGKDKLFFDVSNIEPGEDFVQRIREIVGRCDVLIAVIGPTWSTIEDAGGKVRLFNPRDLVRIEIAAALQRNIRVIPVLIDGAGMPEEHQLPPDLAGLVNRNAQDVSFAHFHADLDSFVRVLHRILALPATDGSPAPPIAAAPVVTELPFTISLSTLGDVSTPLIAKGTKLPAEHSEVFSTATDGQTSVEVTLLAGERAMARDNARIGTFQLLGIVPAPRGVPQVTITATVDKSMILTVTAEDNATKKRQVLDAVDLARIEVPAAAASTPKPPESTRDSPVNLAQEDLTKAPGPFRDFFKTFFSGGDADAQRDLAPDLHVEVTLSSTEAASGVEREIALRQDRNVIVRFPAGIGAGQRLRLRGEGNVKPEGGRGDAYVRVRIQG